MKYEKLPSEEYIFFLSLWHKFVEIVGYENHCHSILIEEDSETSIKCVVKMERFKEFYIRLDSNTLEIIKHNMNKREGITYTGMQSFVKYVVHALSEIQYPIFSIEFVNTLIKDCRRESLNLFESKYVNNTVNKINYRYTKSNEYEVHVCVHPCKLELMELFKQPYSIDSYYSLIESLGYGKIGVMDEPYKSIFPYGRVFHKVPIEKQVYLKDCIEGEIYILLEELYEGVVTTNNNYKYSSIGESSIIQLESKVNSTSFSIKNSEGVVEEIVGTKIKVLSGFASYTISFFERETLRVKEEVFYIKSTDELRFERCLVRLEDYYNVVKDYIEKGYF